MADDNLFRAPAIPTTAFLNSIFGSNSAAPHMVNLTTLAKKSHSLFTYVEQNKIIIIKRYYFIFILFFQLANEFAIIII